MTMRRLPDRLIYLLLAAVLVRATWLALDAAQFYWK